MVFVAREGGRVCGGLFAQVLHVYISFRNPMNAVVGVTDILLDTFGLSDEQTNYIEVIRTSGQHLLTVSCAFALLPSSHWSLGP